MNSQFDQRTRDFVRLAKEKAETHGLRIDSVNEQGVHASLDGLVIEFTQDHGDFVVSLASKPRSDACFAAE